MLSRMTSGPVVEGDKMTLVVAAITKDFAFMACDHRHSLAGTVDKPVEVTIETEGSFNIRVSPPKVAIDIATKVFKSKAGALLWICWRFRKGNQVQDSSRIHFEQKIL